MVAPSGLVGGFGDGFYDVDTYGTPRSIPGSVAITKVPDAYSLDNFGSSILYAMTSARTSRLLMWDPAVGGKAVVQPVSGTRGPVPNGRCFVVTSQRFLMIFGSTNDGTAGGTAGGSARRFAWCDQENPGAWDYTNVTSQAGFLDIEPASPIICAIASRVGVLFWTGKKVYASNFLGSPYIYNYVELADGTTPWSPQSMSTTSALVLWMSEQGVFSYDGTSISCRCSRWSVRGSTTTSIRSRCASCRFPAIWASLTNGGGFSRPSIVRTTAERLLSTIIRKGMVESGRGYRARPGSHPSYTMSPPIFADDLYAFQARSRHRLSELGRQRSGYAAVRRIVNRSQPLLRARC